MIYKRCSRCGKRIQEGTTCECLANLKRERYKEYDKRRNTKSKAFYDSAEWRLTREGILLLDKHVDVYMYIVKQEIVEAVSVHHIVPLREDWDLRCDPNNLISLSNETHSKIELIYKRSPEDKADIQNILKKALKEYRDMLKG